MIDFVELKVPSSLLRGESIIFYNNGDKGNTKFGFSDSPCMAERLFQTIGLAGFSAVQFRPGSH